MIEAPERLFINWFADDDTMPRAVTSYVSEQRIDPPGRSVEYVRANRLAAVEAERDALRAEAMEWRDKAEGYRVQTLADGQRLEAALGERDEARAHWREENSSHAETLLDLKATQDKLAALRDAALAEGVRLKLALAPFAEFAKAPVFDELPNGLPMTQGSPMAHRQVTAGDFKRARAALAPAAETPDA